MLNSLFFLALKKKRRIRPLLVSLEAWVFSMALQPMLNWTNRALLPVPLLTKCQPYSAQSDTSHWEMWKLGAGEEVGRVCKQRGEEVPSKALRPAVETQIWCFHFPVTFWSQGDCAGFSFPLHFKVSALKITSRFKKKKKFQGFKSWSLLYLYVLLQFIFMASSLNTSSLAVSWKSSRWSSLRSRGLSGYSLILITRYTMHYMMYGFLPAFTLAWLKSTMLDIHLLNHPKSKNKYLNEQQSPWTHDAHLLETQTTPSEPEPRLYLQRRVPRINQSGWR